MPDRIDETLTAIENESWLTSTSEPNRQYGEQRRRYVGGLIRQKLATQNRKRLDEALSLNVSFDNSEPRKKLRRGVRAIMLAQFTLKGASLDQAPVLKQRWLNQSEDTIRRGFLACCPATNDPNDTSRLAWNPNLFSDPSAFPEWIKGPVTFQYRFIVTCLPCDDRAKSTLADPNPTISSWSAISASVVDQSNSVMQGLWGLVLRVPAANVFVASSVDQDIKNHLGSQLTRSPEAEANMDLHSKTGLLSQHMNDLYAAQGRLKSPLEIIQQNRNGRWNEVVVLGKSPAGIPTTVTALFYRVATNHRYYVGTGQTKSPVTDDIEDWVTTCAGKFNLPVIYIPDSSGALG